VQNIGVSQKCIDLVQKSFHGRSGTIINAILTPEVGKIAMSTITEILARARGRDAALPYAGAVTPAEAYALLRADSGVKLIDVRTNAERDWVGRVAIAEAQHGAVQWSTYPGGVPNPQFVEQLEAVAKKDQVLLFLCRSGVRSRHAAKLATEHGYSQCYDILEGFEGDKDAEGHRKQVGGWCKAGLPWLGA
jgi:rhodanese-related sulfurtransferase